MPTPPRLTAPDKAARALLPPWPALPASAVLLPATEAALAAAWADLGAQRFIGFDTESRPTFTRGEAPRGPDVVQFATTHTAYVLQMHLPGCVALVRQVLAAPSVVKVGFGIGQDQSQLMQALGQRAAPMIDLDRVFHRQGYPRTIGIQAAVALVFGQHFHKSKRVTTSNWSNRVLSPAQQAYAAADAHVALRVLQGLDLPEAQLPIWDDGLPGRH